MSSFEDFYENSKQLLMANHGEMEAKLIEKAFDFARKMHKNQTRKTKEPYDQHPIRVALKLAKLKADYETICAALLHDVIEDCTCDEMTEEQMAQYIVEEFNSNIYKLVDSVTKFSPRDEHDVFHSNAQTINKLLTSIIDDDIGVRAILIKLCDRDDNMDTIYGHNDPVKEERISKETLDVYVPFATLFGLFDLKEKFEEQCFRITDGQLYDEVQNRKNKIFNDEKFMTLLTRELFDNIKKAFTAVFKDENGNETSIPIIHIREVRLRDKGLYSIVRNIRDNKASDISQVIDLITYRIVIDSEDIKDLYAAMGIINQKYPILNGGQYAFRDYVSSPKNQLYNGLLTYNSVPFNGRKVQVHFEYQTPSMQEKSEIGIASYWNYDDMNAVKEMQEFVKKMPVYYFLNNLYKGYKDGFYNDESLYCLARQVIFSKRIYIKGPGFDLHEAYEKIKLSDYLACIGYIFDPNTQVCLVNDKSANINTVLHNNDYIRIYSKEEGSRSSGNNGFFRSRGKK